MRMKKLLWLEVGYVEISEGANYRGVLTTRGGNLQIQLDRVYSLNYYYSLVAY